MHLRGHHIVRTEEISQSAEGGREKSCGVRKSDGNRKVGEGGREIVTL